MYYNNYYYYYTNLPEVDGGVVDGTVGGGVVAVPYNRRLM